MPWHIEKRDDEFCVLLDEDDSVVKCHPTRTEAEDHMKALYANVEASAPETIIFVGEDVNFAVNGERRTIAGLVVPWNAVAMDNRGLGKWRFRKGSLWWNDTGRVKLNLHHDHVTTVAYATHLQNIPAGLYGKFKVARGEEGDRALAGAQDRILDAFSVEVDPTDAQWEFDRADKSVRNVTRARLSAVGLVPTPAFDDARVELIAASAYRGEPMEKDEKKEPEEDVTFDSAAVGISDRLAKQMDDSLERMGEKFAETVTAGIQTALENVTAQNGPEAVTPPGARFGVLREPPVYRFDGSGPSIVADAQRAIRDDDDEAVARLRKFRAQTEDVATLVRSQLNFASPVGFAPQTTSTASQVIPPGYRPDLYVADLFRERPLISLATQSTIPNAAPFSVPVFGSITTGSATHVEGTNPSDGALAFTTQTVTPQAISGRLVLTRELMDSANPAIDTIAFNEMREAYARQTETAVYTLLNGANGAGGTITSGFVPSGAQAATYVGTTGTPPALIAGIRSRLSAYPFARFASPTGAAMGSNAASILATAADSTGRPIFPSLGPTNAAGQVNPADGTYNVDGLAVKPAWAMTGTAAGDTQILFVKQSDLYVWESPLLTFRFEEKQGPANIELNIFGYFGTKLLRPVGLSGIRIT